ncbi:unnamed protein product [Diatraea saccharalis]|uniref:FP protein C-terminal domain-containing protein n=1 Tax=Diatraea saccharalis TaxID=40085 RepID=A0A9N9N2G1_9NEOP|nr:unnamed protein product [Diatraea saccharalis]
MSSNDRICGGCRKSIEDKRFLSCSACGLHYDLECANVSEQRFYNTMSKDHKKAWKCVMCFSRQPKVDNTNTPVRGTALGVTVQRGAAVESPSGLDMDYLNDTAHNITIEITDFQSLVMEMRAFREEMREEMRSARLETKRLNDTVAALTGRLTECEGRVAVLNERVITLETRLTTEKVDNASLIAEIDRMKSELNDRDQDLLLTELEVTCIQEQPNESLLHIIGTVATKLGVHLDEQDIVSVVRVGRVLDASQTSAVPRTRPIVVRLARRAVRDKLLEAARVRRGVTTEGMGLPGKPAQFFLNERLTKYNRMLFRRARQMGRERGWRFIWTRNGRIFARQHPGVGSIRYGIRAEADLNRVFGLEAGRFNN